MKELWNDFRKWVHFCILDYKDNVAYLEIKEGESKALNEEIERLKKVVDAKNETIKLKELLIEQLMEHMGKTSNRLRQLRKEATTNSETKKRGRPKKETTNV